MYSYGSPHTAAQKQDDQHERTFSSYVRIQVVVLKTSLGRWTIGRSGERGSGISVLSARYDDDDDITKILSFYNDLFYILFLRLVIWTLFSNEHWNDDFRATNKPETFCPFREKSVIRTWNSSSSNDDTIYVSLTCFELVKDTKEGCEIPKDNSRCRGSLKQQH